MLGKGLRRVAGAAAAAALLAIAAAPAQATPAPFDGTMSFPSINGPTDQDEFTWQLDLQPGQYLKLLDDETAEVYFEEGHPAWEIDAGHAHDPTGAEVPTTLAVSEEDLITLVVHDREGNPLAGGAAFAYPVMAGAGWDPGYETVTVKGPPDEAEIREAKELEERQLREARERAEAGATPTPKEQPPSYGGQGFLRGSRACGRIGGAAIHSHNLRCGVARRIYKADVAGRLPSGWTCSQIPARCYRGELGDTFESIWWRRVGQRS